MMEPDNAEPAAISSTPQRGALPDEEGDVDHGCGCGLPALLGIHHRIFDHVGGDISDAFVSLTRD